MTVDEKGRIVEADNTYLGYASYDSKSGGTDGILKGAEYQKMRGSTIGVLYGTGSVTSGSGYYPPVSINDVKTNGATKYPAILNCMVTPIPSSSTGQRKWYPARYYVDQSYNSKTGAYSYNVRIGIPSENASDFYDASTDSYRFNYMFTYVSDIDYQS